MTLCVGKLYQIKFRSDDPYNGRGLAVYENPWAAGTVTPSPSGGWIYLTADSIVMWLGTEGCPRLWGSLLYTDKVYQVYLEHRHNFIKLERVKQ